MDYCTGPSFASGGFIADSEFAGSTVINGSQQQWLTRNSNLDGWTNGVWNQVFSGVMGAPAQCFPGHCPMRRNPYTTLATSPVTREAPYLYMDSSWELQRLRPRGADELRGHDVGQRRDARLVHPNREVLHRAADGLRGENQWSLLFGKNLILTPGVYNLNRASMVTRPDTVVLGLGFPTLIPQNGNASMIVAQRQGSDALGDHLRRGPDKLSGATAGRELHSAALTVPASDPSALQDVFFRIGGAEPGKATISLSVNSDNVILDDIWAWRADHGNGVGWTGNTADTGVIVNGNNVTAYGLFVEHYQKYEVIWNGNGGTDIFFQNEMPYDPPSQAAWMEAPGVDGWAAFKVANTVTSFKGYGMGSYSFFNQGVNIYAANAFEVPATLPPSSLNDLLTIFLSTAGSGGILNVINGTGGSSTIANPDTPVTVVSYP